jgi:Ser/Thr protein kinase RdoA (MazF antagonist)
MLDKVLNTLKSEYKLSFDDIKLHRDMIGFVCIVGQGNTKYILKIFREQHTEQALQSIEIMEYLYNSGYPTARITKTYNGNSYFVFHHEGVSRVGVLYEFIEGTEPDKNIDIESIGRQTGTLHRLMNKYNSKLMNHNKAFFIDRYLDILTNMKYPNVQEFKEYGELLWNRVAKCSLGFCHGDFHTGNMLLNKKGQYVLYDFDASANAFPVFDIAVICDMTNYFSLADNMLNETNHMLERFLKGYMENTAINSTDIGLINDFIAIRHYEVQATIIENLGISCVDTNFIDDQLKWLMKWEKLNQN